MKKNEEFKQDFDRWFLGKWTEETYVPTDLEKSQLLIKVKSSSSMKKWMIYTVVLTVLALLLLFLSQRKSMPKHAILTQGQELPELKYSSQHLKENLPEKKKFYDRNTSSTMEKIQGVPPLEEGIELYQPEELIFVDMTPVKMKPNPVHLDSVMKNLGIFFLQSSTTDEGSSFAGVTSEHKLVVAKIVDGAFYVSNVPDPNQTEGGFRPLGMSNTQYVQYAFYDMRPLLFNEGVYRQIVAINALPKVPYYLRKGSPGWRYPSYLDINTNVPQPYTVATRNQYHFMKRIAGKNQVPSLNNERPIYLRQPLRVNQKGEIGLLIGDDFMVESQGDQVLVVSCQAERVSIVKESGIILASHEIRIQKPRFFSQKSRTTYYDESSKRLYMVIETNFSYLWYEVNELTGFAHFLFKTETVWNQPNWKVQNGRLTYEFKGKKIERNLNDVE
ncbi:MAG: hypothetical protein ACKOXP_10120 [Flavobacteriales bacterium]